MKKQEEKKKEEIVNENDNVEVSDEVKEECEVKSLKEELTKAENMIKEEKDKYLKALAELDNFRKRSEEETKKKIDYAQLNLLKDIMDPLDLLLNEAEREVEDEKVKNYQVGFKMLGSMILNKLKEKGLKVIDEPNVEFDSNLHEAFETVNDETKKENIVVKIIQRGYTFKGLLLRPAKTVINKITEKGEKENGNNK